MLNLAEPDLSAPERRYLLAACTASPQYAFRPRVVGQRASFADVDIDVIVGSLSRAGLIETIGECDVRLTEHGRSAARGFTAEPDPAAPRRKTVLLVALALGIMVVGSLALWWWAAGRMT